MSEQGSVILSPAEVSALVGDDIEFWLANPFMDPEMLVGKVCFWVSRALTSPPAQPDGEASA